MGDVLDPGCGANGWRYTNDWPISHVDTPLYLQASKSLAWDAPVAAGNFSYIYDPRHPVQTLGGTNLVFNSTLPYQPDVVQDVSIGAGIWDQRPIHDRSDVLVFNSTLLTQRVEVVGRVTAKLFIVSNCTDTDFAVKLCDVYPTGQAMVVCDGIASVRKRQGTDKDLFIVPGTTYEIDVDLWSTAYQFNAGHRIQLVITSSNAPKYNPCPNTGAPLNRTYSTFFDANNTIIVDPVHPSAAWLPVHRVF
jgi:putative CocE/NonD family hydrolase